MHCLEELCKARQKMGSPTSVSYASTHQACEQLDGARAIGAGQLLAKAAEQTMDGVPVPECVAPNLCASCLNNQLLLSVPTLLPRIVELLRLQAPPPGLWGHMLAQLPNSQGLMQQWQEEGRKQRTSR